MVNFLKYTLLVLSIAISGELFAQKSEISKYIEQLDSVNMRITLSTLASDRYEGRGPGARGGEITQKYIAAYLDSCGVKRGNDNSYFQNLNHIKSFNVAKRRFIVDGNDYPNDYKYENLYHQDTVLKITEIILIVQGIDSVVKPDNLEGKVIMKPDDISSDFIDRQNPVTVINVAPAFKPASDAVSERRYSVPPSSKYNYNKVSISVNLANKLIKSTGKTLTEIIDEVKKSGKSKILKLKTSAEIHGNVVYEKMQINNIVGIIEGSDLKDEYIILSAHHDHVGIVKDEIYNGADDNASGVSSVLEIARLLMKAKAEGNSVRRSVVILFPDVEEAGLVGSTYYVNNPIFPLKSTRACINVDMVGRIDEKYKSTNGDYIYIVNDEKTNGDLLERIKDSNNDNIIINTEDLNSLFGRSDHYNFAKNNIPAVLITSGLHGDYHTPKDDTEFIDFKAMWKRNRFIFSLVWNLANADEIKQPVNR
jgi:hypothetical protein